MNSENSLDAARAFLDRLAARLGNEKFELVGFLTGLAELDTKKLALELGYPSTFACAVDALGLTESSACRRIGAARMLARFPAIRGYLLRSRITLMGLLALREVLDETNVDELLERAGGLSEAEVRELAKRVRAARSDLTVELPLATPLAATVAVDVAELPLATPPAATVAVDAAPHVAPAQPIDDVRAVTLWMGSELREELAAVRALASHAVPSGRQEDVLLYVLRAQRKILERRRYGAKRRNAPSNPSTPNPSTSNPATPNPAPPNPSTPNPSTPNPSTPNPSTPNPSTPNPSTPNPSTPNPSTPNPVPPNLANDNPANGNPATPNPATPNSAKGNPATPNPATPNPATPNPATPNSAKGNPATPNPATGNPATGNPATPNPDTAAAPTVQPARAGKIPASVRREVYDREGGTCAFVAAGRRCGSTWQIEYQHIIPVARGGDSTAANLTTFCKHHNLLQAERDFGADHVAAKRAARPKREAKLESSPHAADVVSALSNLGYSRREARHGVEIALVRVAPASNFMTLLREALSALRGPLDGRRQTGRGVDAEAVR